MKKGEVSANPDYFGKAKTEINKFIGELIAAGKVTKEEGEKLFKKFWYETEDERDVLKEKISEARNDLKTALNAPSREEFEELKKRVKILEDKK